MSKKHYPMDREKRAKQFIPFAALKGFEDALRLKEKIVVNKIELSEERKEELDNTLRSLVVGSIVTVIYYHDGEYLEKTGYLAKISPTANFLQIVNEKISFENILDIRQA